MRISYFSEMRRRAGVGAVHKQKLEQERYKDKGNEIQESQFDLMSKQLEIFRDNLEEFASKYRHEIKKNSAFRRQFQEMCASIGVDPLASNKGFWSILNIGDFYYELSVQIVEVCLSTAASNGGLISLDELRKRLIKSRGRRQTQDISTDDVLRAAKKLSVLGNGFKVIQLGKGKYMVQSVPGELSMDQNIILQRTSNAGRSYISILDLVINMKWEEQRAKKVLDLLVQEGIAWIDKQDSEGDVYWFPSFFTESIHSSPEEDTREV